MSFVYVVDEGAKVGVDGGVIKVTHKDETIVKIPKETVETIALFGNIQMTTQCTRFCLERGIRVSYFSKRGAYFGCLLSTGHINVRRQKCQIFLSEKEKFPLELSKRIIEAKISNQIVLAKRYLRNSKSEEETNLFQIKNAKKKVLEAKSIEQIMGYEGTASKAYFAILSNVIEEKFKFHGRNRRPPKDPFNAMLSLGYTLLMYELYGEIENRGLNPYVGFLHQDKEKHPTLASDMMEEWRAVIVDSVVMSLIQGHEIAIEDFYYDEENGACILNDKALKVFLNKFEKKLHSEAKYLADIEGRMTFRRAIWHQAGQMVNAIEQEDATLYKPIKIR